MSTSVYETFQDIYEAVMRDAKESTNVTAVVDLVKRWVNEGYEVVNFRKKRDYLNQRFTIDLQGKVSSDFSVTESSASVVHTGTATLLSSTYELGFKVSGFEENYDVSTVSGTLVTLATTYKGDSNTAATGVLYQRSIILDDDISEVYQVWHDYYRQPLENVGPQKMREIMLEKPETYDKATHFAIFGQDSSTNSRRLVIWPFPDAAYTLYVDANVYVSELSSASDEPLIPPQFRQILYWYALAKLFGTYHRNDQREAMAMANFNTWLAKLDGVDPVSQDYARMVISYRRPRRYSRGRPFDPRYREDPE